MNDAYACSVSDLSVDLTDRVTNGVTVDGEVYDNATQLPQASTRREADTSGTSVTVLAPALSKTIYARNGVVGVVAGTPAQFEPDDTITYRLRYVLPSSDIEDFALVDFAPLPILGVGSFSTASPTTTCAVRRSTPPASARPTRFTTCPALPTRSSLATPPATR